mgnify:FL=1
MVIGFVGLPGSGKTYYVTKLALDDIKKGIKVYSNFYIVGATMYDDLETVLTSIEKEITLEQGSFVASGKPFYDFKPTKTTVIIDEINLVCPARFWDTFNPKLAYFWSQSRKLGLNLYWTAQHQDRVDKIVREITNYIWKVKTFYFGYHLASLYDIIKIDSQKAISLERKLFRIHKDVYQNYDTFFRIALPKRIDKAFYKKRW